MAGTAKMTLYFDFDGYGWTETYFRPYATVVSDITAVAQNLITARIALCGVGVTIKYVRISDAAQPGIVYIWPKSWQATAPNSAVIEVPKGTQGKTDAITAAVNSPAGFPYEDISSRMSSQDLTHYRIAYLGGCPAGLVTSPGGPGSNNAWTNAFNTYGNFLTANGQTAQAWLFRCTGRSVPQRFPIQNINAITPAVITAQGSNFQANDVVQIQGFRGIPGVRYKGIVVAPTANTFQLAGYVPSQSIQNGEKGNCFKPAVSYIAIGSVEVGPATERKRGRPFRSPVGRRPSRAS